MKYYQSCSQESTNQCKHFMSCDLKVRAFFTVWLYRDHFRSNIKVYIFWKQKKYKLLSKTDAFQNIFCPHRNKFVLFNPLMTLIQCEWRETSWKVENQQVSVTFIVFLYMKCENCGATCLFMSRVWRVHLPVRTINFILRSTNSQGRQSIPESREVGED
jgi:hypothetical protein